jgi:hypothetical protein
VGDAPGTWSDTDAEVSAGDCAIWLNKLGPAGPAPGKPRPTKLPLVSRLTLFWPPRVSRLTLFTSAARSLETFRLSVERPAFSCTEEAFEDEPGSEESFS